LVAIAAEIALIKGASQAAKIGKITWRDGVAAANANFWPVTLIIVI